MASTYWGVDSAAVVNQTLLDCTVREYGKPAYWGRYLKTVQGFTEGLTPQEVRFITSHGMKILPIYSDFRSALGARQGQIAATNAIFLAKQLRIPKGVVIFANIEHFFRVNPAWIRAWVDTFYPSGYLPGFYHDPTKGEFGEAFCTAAQAHKQVLEQSILWSAEPEPGVSEKSEAPSYAPKILPCKPNVWAWQYGRNAEKCPIDTNLITNKLYEKLWRGV